MAIRLIALDMDGTLLNGRKELPPDFIPWVKAHPEIKVVLASGRQYHTLRRDISPLKDSLLYIAENGGLVFDREQLLYTNAVAPEKVYECIRRISAVPGANAILCGAESAYISAGLAEEIYAQGDLYYTRLKRCDDLEAVVETDTIVKIAIYVEGGRAEERMPVFEKTPVGMKATLSGTEWIDLANSDVNKGTGMEAIQKQYGISPDECMAFGDYLNDVELLQSVTESYCMENGHPDLKKLAKHIAPSNEEYGVMQVLKKVIGE